MRLLLIRAAIAVAVLFVVWLIGGRQISTFLDRIHTVAGSSMPARPFIFQSAAFWINGRPLGLTRPDYQPADVDIRALGSGRVVLVSGGATFPLGAKGAGLEELLPNVEVTPDPGDDVTLTTERSILSWWTPFDFNFMTGHSPSKKRNIYWILAWKKASGAKLEMVWHFEEWLYRTGQWSSSMTHEGITGLVRIAIEGGDRRYEKAAAEYAIAKKGWKREEFRVEDRGLSVDGRSQVLAVDHLADERSPHPGGGLSIVVEVDRTSRQVVRETGGQ